MIETGVLAPPQSLLVPSAPSSFFAPATATPLRQRCSVVSWEAPHPQAGCHVLRSQEELTALWHSQGGGNQPPEVNFQKFMVFAVFAGEGCRRETVVINRIKQDENFITVYVCDFTRPWTTHNPMHVLQVPRSEHPVQFVRLG